MAIVGPTYTGDRGTRIMTWTWTFAAGDTTAATSLRLPATFADLGVVAVGGGTTDTFTLQGSIDGTTFFTANDVDGSAITGTLATGGTAYEPRTAWAYLRPIKTGTTDTMTVTFQANEMRQ